MIARLIVLLCFAFTNQSCAAQSGRGQDDELTLSLPEPSVEVMLVGVLHFAQTDTTQFDVLTPQRQAETAEAVRALARFAPTKVMVERQPYYWQRRIDSTYAEYRAGRFDMPRDEVYQLGYRLADEAGLNRVWAIDHSGFWLGDTLRTVAEELGQTDLLDGTAPFVYARPYETVPSDSLYARSSVGEMLRWMSSPAYQALMYDGYVNRMLRVGLAPGDDFDEQNNRVGGDLVEAWVRRNIMIYRTIVSRTDYGAGERIVVFIGSDHVAPMRQFFEANLNFRMAEVRDYL